MLTGGRFAVNTIAYEPSDRQPPDPGQPEPGGCDVLLGWRAGARVRPPRNAPSDNAYPSHCERKNYAMTASHDVGPLSFAAAPNTVRALCAVGLLLTVGCDHGHETSASTTAISAEVAPASPTVSSPALGGYCPVELVKNGRLVTGDPALTLQYQGQAYQLSSPAAKKAFLQAPQQYVPPFSTYDPVQFSDEGTRTPGSVDLFVIHKDRAWFFLNEKY
jgi:YHS domain-containing protein